MKYFTLLLVQLFALSLWANIQSDPVTYERQDSEHIKEIMMAWDSNKGEYLYESIAAIIMKQQQPQRPQGLKQTSFELLQMMDEQRIDRMDRIAALELENERKTSRNNEYYWEEWREYVQSTKCGLNRGKSSGDPHMTTFDGENYDFQNAGDYLLAASEDNSFYIQTQQYRIESNVALNGGVIMNINGDIVEFKSVNRNKDERFIHVNGEEIQIENADIVLPQGGVIEHKRSKHIVKWPTGEQMSVSRRRFQKKELFDLLVYVPSCNSGYYGLLGNNDGEKNDLVAYDPETGEKIEYARTANSNDDIFGANRRSGDVLERMNSELFFITRQFGSIYQLDSTTSLFPNRMTELPDSIRYPKELLTLAKLDDDQIEEGLRKAKEAGVAEEDLFGAVYDYGYLGLEPVAAYNDDITLPQRSTKYSDPVLNNEENKTKTDEHNRNKGNTNEQIRVKPSVFIGTGGRVISPPTRSRPVITSPRPTTRSSPPSRRTSPSRGGR